MSTASSAPWPIASNTRCAFVPTLDVTTRIAHGVFAMICRVASTPSMRGMIKSMRIRSGVSLAHMVTASAPSRATQTTCVPGRIDTMRRSDSAIVGTSLAMPIFTRRPSDQIRDGLLQRVVVEAALREVVVGARLEPAPAVFLAILVRDDHDRQLTELRVPFDQLHELDAVHARHVDVGDDEIEVARAHGVPAVDAVDRDLDLVAGLIEQLALELAHGERVVHHEHALGASCARRPRRCAPLCRGGLRRRASRPSAACRRCRRSAPVSRLPSASPPRCP